jgi:DnaJ-domain-containing protein 1
MFDRLGDILRDRLDSDEDPFTAWEPETGKTREAGNSRTRTPPPKTRTRTVRIAVPKELLRDFQELGLEPGSSEAECKKSWKRLLLTHHPDLHADNPEEQDRLTKRASRINDAWRRISRWYETGKIG